MSHPHSGFEGSTPSLSAFIPFIWLPCLLFWSSPLSSGPAAPSSQSTMSEPTFQHFPSPEEQAPYEEGFPLPQAPKAEQFPPGGGAQIIPHFTTFSQIVNYASRVYRYTHDEALRDNWNNALAIRRDPVIMDALRSRQLPTAQLPWHLECEDDQDERQAEAVEHLTDIVNSIPRFQMLKMHCLEAIWFGRYGVQLSYSWRFKQGQKFLGVRDFKPINGDKLVFRFSGQPGILVHQMYKGTWEVTDRGRAHFFTPDERDQLIVHRHEPEDADFFEPELGGSLQGVGVRGRLYWLWYLRSQVTAFLMDYLERVGAGGFTIYYYEAGSQASASEVTQAVQGQWRNNAVLFPRYRDGTTGGPGIERIEPSMAGAALMQGLVTDYFDNVMRRYILGQNLTTEAASTGLGSGLADLHGETFARYVKYDATNLGDTLTTDLIAVLQKNSPYCDLPPLRFVFDVDKPNANETLQAAQVFFDMGGSIDEDQLRSVIGLEKPQPGHAMLAKMGAMSPASAGGIPTGVPMLGQPGPDMGQGGEQMPPSDAAGQPPPQMPMMMSRQGRRLRFAKSDFQAAVQEHFPTAKRGKQADTGDEAAAHDYTAEFPEHRVFLNYEPSTNSASLDFRFRDVPEGATNAWQPRQKLGAGSVEFSRRLRAFLAVLARHGVSLEYGSDEHHGEVYSRLLKRLGWRKGKHPLGHMQGSRFDLWHPPTKEPMRQAKTGQRVKFASNKTRRRGIATRAFSYNAEGKRVSVPAMRFYRIHNPERFNQLLSRSTRPENHTQHSAEELANSRMYVTGDGKAGFVIDKNGDLQNVFNNGGPAGAGQAAVLAGVRLGAKTLDAYHGYLPKLYSRFGFRAVAKLPFNDEYAPSGWDYERLGRPPVMFHRYEGGDPQTLHQRVGSFEPYDISKVQQVSDYDEGKALATGALQETHQ